jgi:enolase
MAGSVAGSAVAQPAPRRDDNLYGEIMSALIRSLDALEILDSRGFPTLRATVTLHNGISGTASAPAGASTGKHEVAEFRDEDKERYLGKGVTQAVERVRGPVSESLRGMDARDQAAIDRTLVLFYGDDRGAGLGSNVMCAVSMAAARAAAAYAGLPLYRYLGGLYARRIPIPMMNVINGGKHANNSLDFQEFMIVPHGAPNFSEALRYGAETFQALKAILHSSGHSTAVGDEGGFAPNLASNEQACELIVQAITAAGLKPGHDVALALDPAASSFFSDGHYTLQRGGAGAMSAIELEHYYRCLIDSFPIVSIEDGFAEDDWNAFCLQTKELGHQVQIVGDDLYTTDAARIRRGVKRLATNAVLIKINQIGTLTGALNAIEACRDTGQRFIVSHRSGETEDTFIADFTVGMGGGQIKTGSLSRSERIAKYNRILEIEHELGDSAEFRSPFLDSDDAADHEENGLTGTADLAYARGSELVHQRASNRRQEESVNPQYSASSRSP